MDNGRAFDLFPAERATLPISPAGSSAASPMRPSFSIAKSFPPIRPLSFPPPPPDHWNVWSLELGRGGYVESLSDLR